VQTRKIETSAVQSANCILLNNAFHVRLQLWLPAARTHKKIDITYLLSCHNQSINRFIFSVI